MNFIFKDLPSLDQTVLDKIIELDQTFFPYPWKQTHWNERTDSFSLVYDGNLDRFALFELGDDRVALLHKILVHPKQRGQKKAQELWEFAQTELKRREVISVLLEVSEDNQQAISFYVRQGFQPLNKIKSYYSDGKSALRMQLFLNDALG